MSSQIETTGAAIPVGVALRLCEEIYGANRGKWYTFDGIWCTLCARFSATSEQRCFANAKKPGNRGCAQVNERFDAAGREKSRG